jgi:hypothetical protein
MEKTNNPLPSLQEPTPVTPVAVRSGTKKRKVQRKRQVNVTEITALQHGCVITFSGESSGYLTCLFCTKKKPSFFDNKYVRYDNFHRHHSKKHKKLYQKFQGFVSSGRATTTKAIQKWLKERSSNGAMNRYVVPVGDFTFVVPHSVYLGAVQLGFNPEISRFIFRKRKRDEDDETHVIRYPSRVTFQYLADVLAGTSSYQEIERITTVYAKYSHSAIFQGTTQTRLSRTNIRIGLISLAHIRTILDRCLGFSLAVDGSRWKRKKHIGIRVRVYEGSRMNNIFIGQLPVSKTPVGCTPTKHVFEEFSKLLDNIAPQWKSKMIGITTDGSSDMVGRFNGLQKRFDNACENKLFCVWCGCHQLEVEVGHKYNELEADGSIWIETMDTFITELRKREMEFGSQAPSRANTRWYTVSRSTKWIASRYSEIHHSHRQKAFPCFPSKQWWCVLFAVRKFSEICYGATEKLQGARMTLSQQIAIFNKLIRDLRSWIHPEPLNGAVSVGIGTKFLRRFAGVPFEGEIVERRIDTDRETLYKVRYTDKDVEELSLNEIASNIHGQGDYAHMEQKLSSLLQQTNAIGSNQTLLQTLNMSDQKFIVDTYGWLFGQTIAGLYIRVCSPLMTGSTVLTQPPDVTPMAVASEEGFRRTKQLFGSYATSNGFLKVKSSSDSFIAKVNDQLYRLRHLRRDERAWRVATRNDTTEDVTLLLFDKAWSSKYLENFGELRTYLGALATVFPGTAQVEGDFSVHKLVLRGRDCLSHFGSQSEIHGKQFRDLSELSNSAG